MFSLAILLPIANSEMAKEGSNTRTAYYSGPLKAIAMGQERFNTTYEANAICIRDREDSPFHNATVYCLGAIKAVKGDFVDSGFCKYTRTNGDEIHLTYEAKGKLGNSSINESFKLVGGKGACKGIEGEGESVNRKSLKSSTKGTFQPVSVLKGN